MDTREAITYCGICEGQCGIVVTVTDGRAVKVRPDKNSPLSQGFACPKGIAYPQIAANPDRVLEPMKRLASGKLTSVAWDEALDDIADRLRTIIDRDGGDSIGIFGGHALLDNYSGFFWDAGMCAALGSPHNYTSSSVDINNYWTVGALLYGHPLINPIPDIDRTDFLLVFGANPMISHSSMLTAPRARDHFTGVARRGGRVVVVDPRRSETAATFEWLPIRADEDVLLMASLLHAIFADGLADRDALRRQTTDAGRFIQDLVRKHTPESTERRTGIPAATVRDLARDFAAAPRAAAYGRCGISLGSAGTLAKYLLDALNIVTGNLDRPGGYVFGEEFIDLQLITHLAGADTYDSWRTRVDGFPEVLGTAPAAGMAREITTPGRGQLKALLVNGGNPAMSIPGSGDLGAALQQLELLVSLDVQHTETGNYAHYILPGVLGIERDCLPWLNSGHTIKPFALWTNKAVEPPPGCREEWWVIDQICARLGIVPSPFPLIRALGETGLRLTPQQTFDLFLRVSPRGDLFGQRPGGWNREKAWQNPQGVILEDELATGVLAEKLYTTDKLVHLDQPVMREELARHTSRPDNVDLPLRMVSVRELRTCNTYLLNVEKLRTGNRRRRLRINPRDAAAAGIESGDTVTIRSEEGEIQVEALVSDEMAAGNIALPQGWGHHGGWSLANAAGGANYNLLTTNAAESQDRLSGNGHVNGVDTAVTRYTARASAAGETTEGAAR
jgi:formate dehydrogenase